MMPLPLSLDACNSAGSVETANGSPSPPVSQMKATSLSGDGKSSPRHNSLASFGTRQNRAELEGIEDLQPTPNGKQHRRWKWPTFALIWASATCNPAAASVGAALLALGLSWWEATVAHFLGGIVVVVGLVFTAWPGVKYGIPFPVLARSSFGLNGSHFCTLTRGAVAIMWLSFQTWQGALGIYTSIGVVAGETFLEWGRINQYVTWGQILIMLAYVALHCVVIRAGLKRFHLLVYILSPLQVLLYGGILVWACIIAPLGDSLSTEIGSTGGASGWLVAINASVATWSTLILNVADLSRFCPTQKDQVVGQALGIPVPFAITGWIGMVAAGATSLVYGERQWQIPEYFQYWPAGWAIMGGIVNALSVLSVNVMANLLSPMNDILNISPRRLNFRACGYLCMALSVVLCPWYLFASDTTFVTTFLNGYGMVTGAIAGIIITDFWIVRDRYLALRNLYPEESLGGESVGFARGANWRAFAATFVGVAPCVPGFIGTLGVTLNSRPLEILYAFSWFFALFVSGGTYWALMIIWPPAGLRPGASSFASIQELELQAHGVSETTSPASISRI